MSVYDLLFLGVFVGSVVMLLTIAVTATRGERGRARRMLRIYCICFGVYARTAIVVRIALTRRVLAVGDPQCSDDWFVTVAGAQRSEMPGHSEYTVGFRLSSRARRVSQRERGLVAYLTDEAGTKYRALRNPAEVPFDVLLRAGESIEATRRFEVPGNAGPVDLTVGPEGFGIGWLIIGRSPFEKAVVRIG